MRPAATVRGEVVEGSQVMSPRFRSGYRPVPTGVKKYFALVQKRRQQASERLEMRINQLVAP